MKKWLNNDDNFSDGEKELAKQFTSQFKMGNLLLMYYIEAHTDRVVASAFAMELFKLWMERQQENGEIFIVNMSKEEKRGKGKVYVSFWSKA